MSRTVPIACPSCGNPLVVKRLGCAECETVVEGEYDLPLLLRLDPDEREFLLNMLDVSGSLKDLAKMYGVSYPTVRNRLDALRAKVRAMRESGNKTPQEKSS